MIKVEVQYRVNNIATRFVTGKRLFVLVPVTIPSTAKIILKLNFKKLSVKVFHLMTIGR